MQTFADIIDLWDTATALANEIGEKDGTVRQWRNRNSIPADRWRIVVQAAEKRGYTQVTFEVLGSIAAGRKDTPRGEAA